jgi:hypothetical protein
VGAGSSAEGTTAGSGWPAEGPGLSGGLPGGGLSGTSTEAPGPPASSEGTEGAGEPGSEGPEGGGGAGSEEAEGVAGPGGGAGSEEASSEAGSGSPVDSGSIAESSGSPSEIDAASQQSEPFRFFSPTSFWNEPLAAGAALAPASAEMAKHFSEEIKHDTSNKDPPWINTTSESVPIYTVPANQPTVRVKLNASAPLLQAAWSAVPLPPTAKAAAGTDKVLVVWQPSTDKLWDFWRLVHSNGAWSASWGGAMQNVSSNPGVYGPEAWPGAEPWWGDSASSLEPVGGLISLQDLEMGYIDHAVAIAIPSVRAGVYASPARRTDGKSANSLSLPEGAHLRLDPALDLAALHLPRVTLMIAEAAQRYGLFVRDYAPDVTIYAQDPTPTGSNPYAGSGGYFEGKTPRELLESFPWSHLEVLKMELHSYS